MKSKICRSLCVVFMISIGTLSILAQSQTQSQTSNSISGFVFDYANRTPISEIYVELLNDVYSTLRRVKTDGSGRYFFGGISAGNFKVKVIPYGTNYLEEMEDVEIINYSFGNTRTSDNAYRDIYLKLDKRKINIGGADIAGAVFVQDIPSSARKLYKKGIEQIGNAKEADVGLENLKKALEIFPTYYDVLNKLGTEYLKRKQYTEAVTYLIKSVEVNQRSFSSYYALGLAATDLNSPKEAVEAFRITTVINPQSIYAHMKYGAALTSNGNFKEAEQSLLKAVSLAKDMPMADIHLQLGVLYDKTGRYSEAADQLEKYLKIQPETSNLQQIKKLITDLRSKAKSKSKYN